MLMFSFIDLVTLISRASITLCACVRCPFPTEVVPGPVLSQLLIWNQFFLVQRTGSQPGNVIPEWHHVFPGPERTNHVRCWGYRDRTKPTTPSTQLFLKNKQKQNTKHGCKKNPKQQFSVEETICLRCSSAGTQNKLEGAIIFTCFF